MTWRHYYRSTNLQWVTWLYSNILKQHLSISRHFDFLHFRAIFLVDGCANFKYMCDGHVMFHIQVMIGSFKFLKLQKFNEVASKQKLLHISRTRFSKIEKGLYLSHLADQGPFDSSIDSTNKRRRWAFSRNILRYFRLRAPAHQALYRVLNIEIVLKGLGVYI